MLGQHFTHTPTGEDSSRQPVPASCSQLKVRVAPYNCRHTIMPCAAADLTIVLTCRFALCLLTTACRASLIRARQQGDLLLKGVPPRLENIVQPCRLVLQPLALSLGHKQPAQPQAICTASSRVTVRQRRWASRRPNGQVPSKTTCRLTHRRSLSSCCFASSSTRFAHCKAEACLTEDERICCVNGPYKRRSTCNHDKTYHPLAVLHLVMLLLALH